MSPVFDSNGWRYWRWGGRGLCLGAEKCSKLPQNPQRPVHYPGALPGRGVGHSRSTL